MGKMLILTLLGFFLFALSIGLGLLFMQNLSNNPWYFLALSLLSISLSVYCFIVAARANTFSPKPKKSLENDPSIVNTGLQSSLEKQEEIVKEWRKTTSLQDKLKVMKISASAQESPEQ